MKTATMHLTDLWINARCKKGLYGQNDLLGMDSLLKDLYLCTREYKFLSTLHINYSNIHDV